MFPVMFWSVKIYRDGAIEELQGKRQVDFDAENSCADIFYNHILKQRQSGKTPHWNYHFSITGHPLNAFTDDWDGDLNSGYFEHFPFKSSLPKMITKMKYITESDPIIQLLKLKSEWRDAFRNFKTSAACSNLIKKYATLNEEVVQCPKHLIDMAGHIDSDPGPYFDSSYNWHYAGNGNIHFICIDSIDYLLYSEFFTTYITQFSKCDLKLKDHAASFDCGEGNNIFETIVSLHNIIALRTKHKIFILKVQSIEEKLRIEKIKVMDSELLFTSISFDSHHKNIMYVTTLDCKLTIVHLDRLKGRTVKLKSKVKSLVDNWNAVIGAERAFYTHATRNCITIYDKRTNIPSQSWSNLREITDDANCNDISVAKHSNGHCSLYFGTDHHLFLIDFRNHNKSKPKPVQRWTHGMQSVPTYMSICNFEFGKELICLSSQWFEDTCVVANYYDRLKEININGMTMPYRPPSLLNTLKEAQKKRLSLDLYNPLQAKQLCTSLSGNIVMEQGETYIILTITSLGDISLHTLYPEHMESFINDNSVENLHEWAKCYNLEKKDFEVSSVEDIASVWKILKRVPDSCRLGEEHLMPQKVSKFNESEIVNAFETEQLDDGLLDIWINKEIQNTTTMVDESSLALNFHYSDDSN